MTSNIYINPKINLLSDENYQIIIEFKVKPAKDAIAISTTDLTLDQAMQFVEKSHTDFQDELLHILEKKQVACKMIHSYKGGINGVAMKLSGKAIQKLLSSKVIKAIYLDQEVSIPKKMINPGYQI